MKRLLPLLLLAACTKEPNKTPVVRFMSYAEAIDTAAQNCNAVTETLVITPDGGMCPQAALAGRRSVTLCSDPRNANLPTPAYIKVRADQGDAGAASMGDTIGEVLSPGDCVGFALVAGQPTRCATDQQDAGLQIIECR